MSLHFFSHGSNYVFLFVFFLKNTRNLVQLFQDAYQLPFTSKLKAIKSGVLRESGDYLRWSAECYMFHEYVFLQDSCRCLTAPLQGMASNMPFPSSLGFACCVPHVFEPFNFWKSEGRGGLHYKRGLGLSLLQHCGFALPSSPHSEPGRLYFSWTHC